MEIKYGEDILELEDGTPVTYLRQNFWPTRYRYNCAIHRKGQAALVHQFDRQGHSRDGVTQRLKAVSEYTRWDLYSFGEYVVTLLYPVERELEDFEYVIERKVKNGKVTAKVVK